MNPKKYKTVEECDSRLVWLDMEIPKLESEPISLPGGGCNPNRRQSRLDSLMRERRAIYKRREVLKTNELPLENV